MQRKLRYNWQLYFQLYHLCYYFSTQSYWDDDRKQVLEFKNNKENTIRRFISQSIISLLPRQMSRDLLIIRALSSNELVADTSGERSLDRLGNSLAATFGCEYLPRIVYKRKTTKPVKSLTLTDRQKMLSDVYEVNSNGIDLNRRMILIIDDVVTTGVTSCAIISAILKKFPFAKINVFALAWTPTASQQAYLMDTKSKSYYLNEPEPVYGNKKKAKDVDFENRKTDVSLF
nr:putative amidophosphoribosyltransferase [Mucilaginibacter sp. FT3.2]